jgi:hypothetical protein
MVTLNRYELDLLQWLGREEFSQYGECYGDTLSSLIAKGLAQVHEAGEHQETFIAKGLGSKSMMYRAVSLTDLGRQQLEE